MADGDDGVTDKERLNLFWNLYRDQIDWQRHNETQRATLTNILFGMSAVLVALWRQDAANYLIPCILVVIGIFGVIVVNKYWERFEFHGQHGFKYMDEMAKLAGHSVHQRSWDANDAHNKNWSKWPKLWFSDAFLMQHRLWMILFAIVSIIGLVLGCRK